MKLYKYNYTNRKYFYIIKNYNEKMEKINRKNFFIIDRENFIEYNTKNIKKIVDILNKNKLVIVNWLKNIWKVNFIKEFIHKTKLNNNYFYFNKSDDVENYFSSSERLESLFNDYLRLYKNPKIIILQDISKINWIKNFISKIYKENYKTILVWNDIKISGINEIEIFANIEINYNTQKNEYENLDNTQKNEDKNNINIDNILKYWSINEVKQVQEKELKEKLLVLLKNDIFLNSIFKNFWVKNIFLYNLTITFLSYSNTFISLRELHKSIENIQSISLKTIIDYIDFSIQEKILKRVYNYDLKLNKVINTKAKYYFSDNWIRNSLNYFNIDRSILLENLIFNILEYNNYGIYWWINWKFNFSFYCVKNNNLIWEAEQESENSYKIFVHISNEKQKEEVKKEVNKLLKIWGKEKKYLLVENIENLWIKKFIYDTVEIIEVAEFLQRFTKK